MVFLAQRDSVCPYMFLHYKILCHMLTYGLYCAVWFHMSIYTFLVLNNVSSVDFVCRHMADIAQ